MRSLTLLIFAIRVKSQTGRRVNDASIGLQSRDPESRDPGRILQSRRPNPGIGSVQSLDYGIEQVALLSQRGRAMLRIWQ